MVKGVGGPDPGRLRPVMSGRRDGWEGTYDGGRRLLTGEVQGEGGGCCRLDRKEDRRTGESFSATM